MSKKVHIIGAGISGLTLAWELQQRGAQVCLYDRHDRGGGLIQSIRTGSHLRELAANGILWSPQVQKLFDDLGLPLRSTKQQARKKFIFRKRPRRWPLSFFETLHLLAKGLWFAYQRKVRHQQSVLPQKNETVAEWSQRNFTEAFRQYILAPALSGIYADKTQNLSAALVFQKYFSSSQEQRKTMAPPNGMGELVQTLEKKLKAQGVQFFFQKSAEEIKQHICNKQETVVLATSAWDAAEILQAQQPEIAAKLFQVRALPLLSVTLTWRSPDSKIGGFGCLFPEQEKFYALGVLSNTDIFADRGPFYSETWILGGVKNCHESDHQILEMILDDRKKMLKATQKPDEVFVQRYEKAIPAYDLDLEKILAELKASTDLERVSIFLTGNYLGSLGLSQIYSQNVALAERIMALR